MNHIARMNSLLLLLALLSLVACTRAVPVPSEATINGVTSIDRAAGRAELSVSALDHDGAVLTSGAVRDVTATVEQAGFAVGAGVCGDIASKGALTATITLDASGSMEWNDPHRQRAAAAKAFVVRLRPDDQVAVTAFEGSHHILTQPFTSDIGLLYEGIELATYVGGGTPLWDASHSIVNFLVEEGGGNLVALIFTDGEDTGSRSRPSDVIGLAQREDVRVFMIGLGSPDALDTASMESVSTETGGIYENAMEAASLERLFENVFNAAIASGCIDLTFNPVPSAGQAVSGELGFTIDGGRFTGAYEVRF